MTSSANRSVPLNTLERMIDYVIVEAEEQSMSVLVYLLNMAREELTRNSLMKRRSEEIIVISEEEEKTLAHEQQRSC